MEGNIQGEKGEEKGMRMSTIGVTTHEKEEPRSRYADPGRPIREGITRVEDGLLGDTKWKVTQVSLESETMWWVKTRRSRGLRLRKTPHR